MPETGLNDNTRKEQLIQANRLIIRVGPYDITLSEPFEVKPLTDRLRSIVQNFHHAFASIHFCNYSPKGLMQGAPIGSFDQAKGLDSTRGSLLDETVNNYLIRWMTMNRKDRDKLSWSFFTRHLRGDQEVIGHSLVNAFQASHTPQDIVHLLAEGYFEGDIARVEREYEQARHANGTILPSWENLSEFVYIPPQIPNWLTPTSVLATSDPHHDAVTLYLLPHVIALTVPPLMCVIREKGLALTPETWGGSLLAEAAIGTVAAVQVLPHEVCHGLAFKRFQNDQLVQDGFYTRRE